MLDFLRVKIASNEMAWVGFGEREYRSLDHRPLGEMVDRAESTAIVVLTGDIVRWKVGGDELGSGRVNSAAECFELTGLYDTVRTDGVADVQEILTLIMESSS